MFQHTCVAQYCSRIAASMEKGEQKGKLLKNIVITVRRELSEMQFNLNAPLIKSHSILMLANKFALQGTQTAVCSIVA